MAATAARYASKESRIPLAGTHTHAGALRVLRPHHPAIVISCCSLRFCSLYSSRQKAVPDNTLCTLARTTDVRAVRVSQWPPSFSPIDFLFFLSLLVVATVTPASLTLNCPRDVHRLLAASQLRHRQAATACTGDCYRCSILSLSYFFLFSPVWLRRRFVRVSHASSMRPGRPGSRPGALAGLEDVVCVDPFPALSSSSSGTDLDTRSCRMTAALLSRALVLRRTTGGGSPRACFQYLLHAGCHGLPSLVPCSTAICCIKRRSVCCS